MRYLIIKFIYKTYNEYTKTNIYLGRNEEQCYLDYYNLF